MNRLRDEKMKQSYSAALTKQIKEIEPTCSLEEHTKKIEQAIKTTVEATLPEKRIENVEKFEYLGSLLTWDNNCSEEIKRRIGKATGAMATLRHIWNSNKLKLENKPRILTTCMSSVLLYASET